MRAGDVVVVVGGHAAAFELAAEKLAVEADLLVMAGVAGDAVEVAIVVTEDDVDRLGEAAAELMDDERRAEIAAANHGIGAVERPEGAGQEPDVIVNVGKNRDAHDYWSLRTAFRLREIRRV